jgi:cytochrome c biogenesis protein CcdA
MNGLALGILTAFWLGILTSISPCPLATNVAAISYMARSVARTRTVILSGVAYSAGRMVTYVLVALVILESVFSIPSVSYFLQKYMNKALGPLLILVGMVLVGLISFRGAGSGATERIARQAGTRGVWGAGVLGVVFALSFCPVSAALFFGSLIPLSLKHSSPVALPAAYGAGTGLPVLVFAFVIALGTRQVAAVFNKLTQVERWLRLVTGGVFIAVGIYLTLTQVFHLGA